LLRQGQAQALQRVQQGLLQLSALPVRTVRRVVLPPSEARQYKRGLSVPALD
jgi:hypothetical protein